MKKILIALLLAPIPAFAQDAAEVRRLFEAGRFQQVIEVAGSESAPEVLFTIAQSHQKLGAADQVRDIYSQLAGRPEGDVWHYIGDSARKLLDNDVDGALEAARQAAERGEGVPEAQYQLGLVLAKRQEWRDAADAFDRAAQINPSLAYAHYYGGLMHYRANRPDRMAIHFEQFLKLAPEAPERPEVLQIMRTVRGR